MSHNIFNIFRARSFPLKNFLSVKLQSSNMLAVSYLFAYSFNFMRMRHPVVPVCAPPDPVRVLYSGSNDTIDQVPYIVCLNDRVPKCTSFGVSMLKEFARFIRLLEFDSLTILEKILSRISSSIRGDAVFPSLVRYR